MAMETAPFGFTLCHNIGRHRFATMILYKGKSLAAGLAVAVGPFFVGTAWGDDGGEAGRSLRGGRALNLFSQTTQQEFFLLGGQSNMNGHTTSGQSIGGNGDYWNSIRAIIDSTTLTPDQMEVQLRDLIYATNVGRVGSTPYSVAANLTDGTMTLKAAGLLENLDTALPLGNCSFVGGPQTDPQEDISGGVQPIVPGSNCGQSFGHELMLGRTLELCESGRTNNFELVKNARGGTEIHQHWFPNYGMHWDELLLSITSRSGQGVWKAFVWHQGSQESWTTEDTSLTYGGNLTGLVAEVRSQMYAATEATVPGYWTDPSDIPVVIVQVGYWPQNDRAQRVREAQANFCNQVANNARLVTVDDLSRFYHFDAPSFLISGHRIAQAYMNLAGSTYDCENTLAPTQAPTSAPTSPPSPAPTAAPTTYCSKFTTKHPCNDDPDCAWVNGQNSGCFADSSGSSCPASCPCGCKGNNTCRNNC